MKEYQYAVVKFNGGVGALLCNGCHIIIEYGMNHKDVEHYCDDCDDADQETNQTQE